MCDGLHCPDDGAPEDTAINVHKPMQGMSESHDVAELGLNMIPSQTLSIRLEMVPLTALDHVMEQWIV